MRHEHINIKLGKYTKHNTKWSRKHNTQFLQIRHTSNIFFYVYRYIYYRKWNSLLSSAISCNSLDSFQTSLINIEETSQSDSHYTHWREAFLMILLASTNTDTDAEIVLLQKHNINPPKMQDICFLSWDIWSKLKDACRIA